MSHVKLLGVMLLVSLLFVPVAVPITYADGIVLAGSSTVKKYIEIAKKAYEVKFPESTFEIEGGGSRVGYTSAVNSQLVIGMMSREITAKESENMLGYKQVAFAYDAVSVVVSDEVFHAGITSITMEDLASVYREKIKNWSSLGGQDNNIFVVDRATHHGTHYVFAEAVFANPQFPPSPESIILESNQEVYNCVRASDQAIGYISQAYVDEKVHALTLRLNHKELSFSNASAKDGSYPLSRTLYLIISEAAPPSLQRFVDFVLSPEGQALVKQAGYIPL